MVIKLGSSAIASTQEGIDSKKLKHLVSEVVALHKQGIQVIVVSSGAIAVGKKYLKYDEIQLRENRNIAVMQALSAVGQPYLMSAYNNFFAQEGVCAAQILLTHEDFKDRTRYLNMKNTINELLEQNVIPVLNENDSVSFSEISLGDNDQLAAMTAQLLQVDLLVMLTEYDGLYDKNPNEQDATHIPIVPYRHDFKGVAFKKKSSVGTGGMKTKLEAVTKLTSLGIPVVIASHNKLHPIDRAVYKEAGTYFAADSNISNSKKKGWIVTTVKQGCHIVVDEGAYRALKRGASLLPSGITKVNSKFKRGDSIFVKYGRKTVAIGFCEYDSKEIEKIKGQQATKIIEVLGFCHSSVVLHRNNMVLKE